MRPVVNRSSPLSVAIGAISNASGFTAIRSDVAVLQLVQRIGSPDSARQIATTYETSPQIGLGSRSSLVANARQTIEVQLEEFLNAYLKANPRR